MMAKRRPSGSASQPGLRWVVGWALLGSLLAFLTFAPAAWLAQGLNSVTAGRLQLHEARGTVWQGSARLFLTGGPGSKDQAYLPGAVHWTIRPQLSSLLVDFVADCCTPKAITFTLAPGIEQVRVQVSDHASRLPAALLSALGTPWNTIGLDGSISMQSKGLQILWVQGRLRFEGSASIAVQQASSRLTTVRPLGNYLVTIQGGAAPVLDLATLDGALQLTGNGQWTGARFRFNGQASASPEAEASLNNLLNIIGRRKGAVSLISLG